MNDRLAKLKILVNDRPKETVSRTVRELLDEMNIKNGLIAIAKNDNILARSGWDTDPLNDGDIIEIISPIGGG